MPSETPPPRPRLARRRFLAGLTGLAFSLSLAGCSGGTPSGDSTPTGTSQSATGAQTEAATPLSDSTVASELELDASMLSQSSPESPARFEATLRNGGPHTLKLGFGPTLMFSAGGGVENVIGRGDALRVVPDGEVGLVETPSESNESGCWRAEGVTAVQAILRRETLEPGDTVSETYSIYTAPDAPTCLPDGEDAIRDTVLTDDGRIVTTVSFAVEDGAASVSGSVGTILDDPSRGGSRPPSGSPKTMTRRRL